MALLTKQPPGLDYSNFFCKIEAEISMQKNQETTREDEEGLM